MTAQVPALGLLVPVDGPQAEFLWLVRELGRWCVPVSPEPGTEPDAYLAASPRAHRLTDALRTGKPTAVWIDDDDPPGTLRPAATLLLTADIRLAGNDRYLFVPPDGGLDVDAIPPVPPFLRARIRRREGLPSRMVVDLRRGELPEELVPAALSVCSACVATGGAVEQALARATPTVTDADSAAALGARAGIEVAVGEDGELTALAEELASDERAAAALSRAGRRLVESRRRRSHVAPALAAALGLFVAPGSRPRIDAVLDTMNTPARALIRSRVRIALSPYLTAGAFIRSG